MTLPLTRPAPTASRNESSWSFLTNHGATLIYLAKNPTARLRDVAVALDITERAAQRIVTDLVNSGYITRTRIGRNNHYQTHPEVALKGAVVAGLDAGALITISN